MSSRARKEPALDDSLALAVTLSSSIMFVRMGILVAIAAPGLLRLAWLPLAAMAAGGFLASLWFYRRAKGHPYTHSAVSDPLPPSQTGTFPPRFAPLSLRYPSPTAR